MSKTRKVFVVIFSILIALTLVFIWGNSIISADISEKESTAVFSALQSFFDSIFGAGVITAEILRKIAHGTEFFILGLEFSLLYISAGAYGFKTWFFILVEGVIIALIDETLQIFSDRGPAILDVWIDAGGVAAISIIFGLIGLIVKAATSGKRKA